MGQARAIACDTFVAPDGMDYETAVKKWAASLDEVVLRSMARDYRNGMRDEATLDAWLEFKRRASAGLLAGRKTQPRCALHEGKQGPRSLTCEACAILVIDPPEARNWQTDAIEAFADARRAVVI